MLLYAFLTILSFAASMMKPDKGKYDIAGYLQPASMFMVPFFAYQTVTKMVSEGWGHYTVVIGLFGLVLTLLHIMKIGRPTITIPIAICSALCMLLAPSEFIVHTHIWAMTAAVLALAVALCNYLKLQ